MTDMRTAFLATSLILSGFSQPVFAQAQTRVLDIFGNDKCPTNAAGEEIVVCARRPEAERYRIPKEFRQSSEIAPGNQSWANRAASLDSVGRTGTDSCSTTGPSGWTGCWAQQMRQARAEKRAAAAADSPP